MTEPRNNDGSAASDSTIRALWSTKRGRLILAAALAAGLMIAGLVVGRVFVPPWQTWYFKTLGIAVELPARPVQTVAAPRSGNAAFECRTPEMTVLVAGQTFTDGDLPQDVEELARRALEAVRAHPDVDSLTVRTRRSVINGIAGLELGGSLKRKGTPGLVRGFVVLAPPRAWQVLIFFSSQDQQQDAQRILRSFRRVQHEGDAGTG